MVVFVGPVIQLHECNHPWCSVVGFWNFIGTYYLQRRAHEFLATNTIDGGLSVLRSEIYTAPGFRGQYLNERPPWFKIVRADSFPWIWPKGYHTDVLESGDDKFHTCWLATHGWKIKIQGGASILTELGFNWEDYRLWCIRWNKSTFQSNLRAPCGASA